MTSEQFEIVEQHIRNRRGFTTGFDGTDVAAEMNQITDALEAMLVQCRALEDIQGQLYCSKCGEEYMKVCVLCECSNV